jgi:putative salt-induced outer membrane protein YdiY
MKFRNASKSAAIALILFAASFASAQTVSLELKSGDRVTGRVVSENTNAVTLSNAWAGALVIPLVEISKRTVLTNGAVVVATNNAPTNAAAIAKAVANTNALFKSPLLKNWHGELQVGADLTFSERDRQVYNGKSKLVYTNGPVKAFLDYDMTYGRSEVDVGRSGSTNVNRTMVTDANRMNGSVKVEYDLTKRWYLYNLAGAGYDEIRKIDLRWETGPGVGYHLIRTTNLIANVEAGFNYQNEEHTDGTSVKTFFYRFAENAAWKITPRLTWDEKFEYLPRVEDVGQYRFTFETNLRYAMLQNIFLNLSLIDIYDSEPAGGVARNDLQFRSSVGVRF